MPLTPEEEAEYQALKQGTPATGLTPEEEAEYQQLKASQSTAPSFADRTLQKLDPLLPKPLPIPQNKEEWTDRAHLAANVLPMMIAPETALGRIGVGALAGAAQNATNRNDPRGLLERSSWGAARGGTLATGGEVVNKAGSKLADWLMQKAVGMKKYLAGAGNTLVNEGLVGTKNMMANQVGPKLEAAETELQQAAGALPGQADPRELANKMVDRAQQRFVTPDSGRTLPLVEGDLNKAVDLASNIEKMGPQSARDLVSLKRQGDWGGFTAGGSPSTAMEGELGRMTGDWSRGKLSDMSAGLETTIPDILQREQALVLAKKGLTRPDSLASNPISALNYSKWPGGSLAGSLGAHASQKTGEAATSSMLQQILRSLTQ